MARSVLVAGASGGLGSAIATRLAERGDALTLVARNGARLEALDIAGTTLAVDLRTPTGCAAAVGAAVEAHGRLDVVVNAVGVVAFGPAAELSVDAMEELFLTNVFVPIMLASATVPALDDGGVIINVSGVVAERNLPGMAAYGASKAAVRSFDEAFGREVRRHGIRVIDARPPHTATGLASRAIEGTAPRLPEGLAPAAVAQVICDALDDPSVVDLPSSSFPAP